MKTGITLNEGARHLLDRGHEVDSSEDSIVVSKDGKSIKLGVGKQLDELVAGRTTVAYLWSQHRLNACAIMTFRDTADGDYVAARLSFRSGCFEQFLWSAEQAIEKYLKCILVLRRVGRPAPKNDGTRSDVGHDLEKAASMIGWRFLRLTPNTRVFIEYLNRTALGARYFEVSTVARGHELVSLDRSVWELRRHCTTSPEPARLRLSEGEPAPKYRLEGGRIEKILDNSSDEACRALLWQNAFFGRRTRYRVKKPKWGFHAKNAPLFVMPDVSAELEKYAYVTPEALKAYKALAEERAREQEEKEPDLAG